MAQTEIRLAKFLPPAPKRFINRGDSVYPVCVAKFAGETTFVLNHHQKHAEAHGYMHIRYSVVLVHLLRCHACSAVLSTVDCGAPSPRQARRRPPRLYYGRGATAHAEGPRTSHGRLFRPHLWEKLEGRRVPSKA